MQRERCKSICKQLEKENIPPQFPELKNHNYRWVLSDKGNLEARVDKKEENRTISIVYVDSEHEYAIKKGIQADFKYARKIILAESEVDIFVDDNFALKRNHLVADSENTDPQKIMEQLYISKEKARKSLETEIEVLNRICTLDNRYLKKTMPAFRNLIYCIEELEGKMPEIKRQRRGGVWRARQDNLDCDIKVISSNSIDRFRKYKGEYAIPFKRVNLFYGENGAGNTSLLEAIEYGITGCNRSGKKEKATEGSINIKCIRNQNNHFMFSVEREYYNLAKSWYGIEVSNCEEFNRFFTQYNYFDTSWASAFAIEGKESVNINQLKNYLNLENTENCQKILHEFYEQLQEITKEREKDIGKLKKGNSFIRNGAKRVWRMAKS